MKKIFICLLSIFMLVSLAACGGSEGESVSTAGALSRKLESKSDKIIEISEDIVLTEPIEIVGNKEIVGSGTITVSVADMEDAYVINLADGAQLTVGGNVEIDLSSLAGGIHVQEGTTLTLQDEAIVKGASVKSSNVLVEGTFTMNGGFLKYSNGHNLINKSVTTIAGGELKGSGKGYAVVYNEGTLTQDDGVIVGGYNNVVGIAGSSFTWNKGENKTSLQDAIVIEEGATIHITSADAKLTGVYAKGLVVNGEGVIDGATMSDSMDSMVVVGLNGKLTVNGGKITEAGVNGIDNAGTMIMTNGTIYDNHINGICNTGTLEITGGNILDNDSKGILNKAGTAKLLHEDVFINGNRFGIANEIGAYFEIAAATIIQSGESNVYAYGGDMYFHDVALKSSGAGCMNVATANVILENVAIQGTNGGSGAHGIYMTGGTVTAKDTTFSAVNGSAIRVKGDAVFNGTNLTIEKIEHNGIFISGGTVDIDKLTTSDISGCNVYADGGTLDLSDSSLGKCSDWSIKAYGKDDAVMNLNNVKILGHENPVNNTVGGINVSGGTVTARNLTINNTVSKAIQNKGGNFTGKNVKISNVGGFGVSAIGGTTEFTKLTTSGVKSCNIYMESNAVLTVTDATLGKCTDWSIKAYGKEDSVMNLQNVEILGHENPVNNTVGGINVSGGTVTAKNITVSDVVSKGIQNKGGKLTAEDVKVTNTGGLGISAIGGVTEFTKLTTSGVQSCNIYMENNAALTVTDAVLGKCVDNSIKAYGNADAVLNLNNVEILGQTKDALSNVHGLIINNGTVTAKNLTIQDTVASGVRVRGGNLNAEDVTISSVGADAINMTAGTADIKTLTTSGVTACNVYMENNAELTMTDAKLGKCKDNIIKAYGNVDAVLNLNNVTMLGHTDEVTGNLHGLNMRGGTVTANGLTIQDTVAAALRVNGGNLDAEGVEISNVGADGVNMTAGTAEIDGLTMTTAGSNGIYMTGGTANIKTLITSGVTECNIYIPSGSPNLTIAGAELGKCGDNSIKEYGDNNAVVDLSDVTIYGHTDTDKWVHGLIIKGGTITAKNLTIQDTIASGLRLNGGNLTAEDVTISNVGADGVNMTAGTAEIDGLTMTTVGNHGVYMSAGTANITGLTMTQVTKDGVNMIGGTAEIDGLIMTTVGSNGIYMKGGTADIKTLTTSGVTECNIYIPSDAPNLTITGAELGKCKDSSIKVQGNKNSVLNLNDVTIYGHADTELWVHGLIVDNGTVTAKNLTIQDTIASGLRVRGGSLTAEDVKILNAGSYGVNVSGGTLTLNGADMTDTQYDVYNTTSNLKLAGVIKADVYNDAAVTINADSLAGSEMTIDWNLEKLPTTMVGIQFSSDENATASATDVTFGSNLANNYVPYFTKNQMLIMDKNYAFFTVSNYEELAAALKYMDENEVTTATITLDGDIVVTSTITIKAGKNITIVDDGNVRTIKRTTDAWHMITVKENASLTFRSTGTANDYRLVLDGAQCTANLGAMIDLSGNANTVLNVYNGVKFQNINTTAAGATIRVESAGGVVNVDGARFENISAKEGSAFYLPGGNTTCTIKNTVFKNCSSTPNPGGAVVVKSGVTCTISDTKFVNCSGTKGGAISNAGILKLTDCTFTDNNATSKYKEGIPYGNDICIGSAAAEVHISGKLVAEIFNETTSAITVDGTLEEGSDVKVEWCADDVSKVPQDGVKFANAAVMEASKTYISLGELTFANYSLTYVNTTGKLVKPYVVTNFNGETESLTAALKAIETDKLGVIRLGSDIDVSSAITIPANCNITIEDDGCGNVRTINSKIASKDWHMITVKNDATLTLRSTGTANDYRLVLDGTSVTNKGAMIDLSGDANTVLNVYNGVRFQNINTTAAGGTIRVEDAGGVVNVDGAHFEDVSAKEGSAFYFRSGDIKCTIKNVVFKNCSSSTNGGAVHVKSGATCTITDSTFEDIHCGTTDNNNHLGGAIYVLAGGTCTITDTKFDGCYGRNGGAIYNAGNLKLVGTSEKALFTGNYANRWGGAVYTTGGTFEIDGYTFDGNYAKAGGAILMFTASTIKNTTFKNNHTNVSGGFDGGAIYANKNFTLTDCIFENNMAIGKGGAIYSTDAGVTCTLVATEGFEKAVFKNNTADGEGDAIYVNKSTLTGSGYIFTPEFSESVYNNNGTINYSN